ncbi:MAG: GNAT family N-acetyltransferase [Propionicimonas sp.]
MIDFQQRPVDVTDSDALYILHRATMGRYIEDVYGVWDEDVQQAFHEAWMQHDRAQVVEVSGHLVGVVDIEWREDHLHLARIEISPELQNFGVGAEIIQGLIHLAASRERAVALDVFDVNAARRLYERLGFEPIGVSGRKIHMRRAHIA